MGKSRPTKRGEVSNLRSAKEEMRRGSPIFRTMYHLLETEQAVSLTRNIHNSPAQRRKVSDVCESKEEMRRGSPIFQIMYRLLGTKQAVSLTRNTRNSSAHRRKMSEVCERSQDMQHRHYNIHKMRQMRHEGICLHTLWRLKTRKSTRREKMQSLQKRKICMRWKNTMLQMYRKGHSMQVYQRE